MDAEYGVFKKLCTDNHYSLFTKTLNSAISTRDTLSCMKRITRKEIVYGHMGQLIVKDGIAYATFIQNPGNDGEGHSSDTSEVVLAVFSVAAAASDDFSPEKDVTLYRIGGRGGSCAGHTAMSIFKDNSMCLVGDTLMICFSFIAEDKKAHIFRKSFHIPTSAWQDETAVRLIYKGTPYDFTDETLNLIYRDKGLEERAEGLIELVSAWNEYQGEYYATGLAIERANNGIAVKTRDFVTMEVVDALAFNDMGTAEIASAIYRDRLYVACRQDYGIPYLILNYYDLKTHTWSDPYRIEDGNVRPWFFLYQNELYLLNTVEEYSRRYTNISKVRYTGHPFFDRDMPVETMATLKGCGGYYAVVNENEHLYFVSSKDTISFGEMKLTFLNEDTVNEKLLSLFA